MYMLAFPIVLYLLSSKWDLIKKYLPQRLLQLTSRPAETVNVLHALYISCLLLYFLSLPLSYLPDLPYLGDTIPSFLSSFYRLALMVMVCGSLITITANNGAPPIKEGWEKVKIYLAQVQMSLEFAWLFYGFIFLSADSNLLIVLIPARRSVSGVCKFVKKKIEEMGKAGTQRAAQNNPQLATILSAKPYLDEFETRDEAQFQSLAAVAELLLGFFLIIKVFVTGFNGAITAMLYWQLLRLKFHHPKTKSKQIAAWSVIGDKVEPIFALAPPVRGVVEKAKGVYCQAPGAG